MPTQGEKRRGVILYANQGAYTLAWGTLLFISSDTWHFGYADKKGFCLT